MCQFVPDDFGLDAKTLEANVAAVIFLAGVGSRVHEHLLPPTKLLATVGARMRKLVGVKLVVTVKTGF